MEKEALETLIEVEKEIHERIELEKRKAMEMVKTVRNQTLESLVKEEEELKASAGKAVADAAENAEKEAFEIVQHAHAEADRLRNISDDLLQSAVRKVIGKILP
jgi:vacuolar-type H+-ATPase subunit H